MDTLRKEIFHQLPKIISNLIIALFFWVSSYIFLAIGNGLNSQNLILFQLGLLFITGIFLLRTLLNALPILDKINGSVLKLFKIKDGLSNQRILKDTLYIVGILLMMAAIIPIFNHVSTVGLLLQQITTYIGLGFILFFILDIGRICYRVSKTKANSLATWIARIKYRDEKTK